MAGALGERGLVGGVCRCPPAPARRAARRRETPAASARERSASRGSVSTMHALGIAALDRVGRRQRRDRRAVPDRGIDGPLDQLGVTSGRAASWITTMSASCGTLANALATESCRRSPPSTISTGFRPLRR